MTSWQRKARCAKLKLNTCKYLSVDFSLQKYETLKKAEPYLTPDTGQKKNPGIECMGKSQRDYIVVS